MAGIELQIELSDLAPALATLNRIGDVAGDDLLPSVGALVESQTRRRLADDKSAPDGTPWPAWSPGYAGTRSANQSLLVSGGGLIDSVAWVEQADAVAIGSDLVYAATHQFGSEDGDIPAREWLGLSGEDAAEITDLISDLFGGAVQ